MEKLYKDDVLVDSSSFVPTEGSQVILADDQSTGEFIFHHWRQSEDCTQSEQVTSRYYNQKLNHNIPIQYFGTRQC